VKILRIVWTSALLSTTFTPPPPPPPPQVTKTANTFHLAFWGWSEDDLVNFPLKKSVCSKLGGRLKNPAQMALLLFESYIVYLAFTNDK